MPIGIIVNVLSVFIGGILGAVIGNRMSDDFKENMNMVFGACAMAMGVASIVLMENMPAVILALILGTIIGLVIHLGELINAGGAAMQRFISRFVHSSGSGLPKQEFESMLLTIIVIFCASGTGIYGSMVSGMTGDHSILLAKSIMDLFTALVFGCSLGAVVSLVAVPQGIIFILMFVAAGVIYPLTTPVMIADFKACGGIIMLVTGFRMIKVKEFPVADMIPAMILAMPFSWLWTSFILPFVS
ncbi:MAG: DUF554 domain-containing protein [Lachnospiraceae bacterium]|nr:DUF554 domain-containing protein [Lachnospiraceae bacterium]